MKSLTRLNMTDDPQKERCPCCVQIATGLDLLSNTLSKFLRHLDQLDVGLLQHLPIDQTERVAIQELLVKVNTERAQFMSGFEATKKLRCRQHLDDVTPLPFG